MATAAVTALQTPHWTDVAGVFVALLVGGAQCGLIAWGIRVMRDSNLTRESRHEEVMTAFARRDKEDQQRHEEVMASLTRRDKEEQQRHEEAMATFTRQGEETERQRAEGQHRHEEAMAALTALIERTAPQGNV